MAARPRPGPVLALFPVLLALLVVVATAPPSPAKSRVYLSSWAVRVAAGLRDARALARRHGLLYLGQVMEGEPFHHFSHRGTRQRALSRHWGWHMRLARDPQVLWFEQQTVKKRVKRGSGVVPTDPWFPKQWYMNNDVHPDLNILTAWSRGYTGLGVVLTVLDDGLEKDHPDLAANYDPLASYDFNSNDPDPQPRYGEGDKNWHGTRCAGEVAAVANNGVCGAGVAYNSKIGGVRMLDGSITDIVEAQALGLQLQYIHIYSASWGPEDDGRTVDGPGVLAAAAFQRGVVQGRGGLGSIFIWASGNGGTNYDNCNCDGYTNSIYTVSVGSVLGDGQRPRYSESCPAILTTTYSSRTTSKVQIVTTDLHHRCTDKHTGTSASAPLAAGMVALALEANPALTWRDLQHLIVRASKPAHLQAEDWAENGVGRRVSHYYGYGLLDAGLLVQAATTWTGTRPQEKCSVQAVQVPRDIGSRLTISTDASSCSESIRSLEHVQVQLSLSYSRRGDLVVALSSPMGTTSTLVTVRPYDTSQDGYKDWSFMSTHFWDENPKGIWTLQLENRGDNQNTGQLTSFTLHLHGTDEDMPARPSAATATDECLRRDEQGACEDCGSSLYTHHGSCLSYCPPRYYGRARSATPRDTARVCASCHPSCYTCQGSSANNCTSCPSGRTFHDATHTCQQPEESSPGPVGLRRDLVVVTVLACSSLVLAGVLYPTYRTVLCAGKGAPCCAQAGGTE
ncbi:proprotein convertase subtilisin/kexin type 4 isoform X1 [Parus major]|uniref:proprotein convertase subtilisin/kexin type 4 isoform X1 n=1 Tax=Parus major TaxID=9157 RepID=UPI000771581E|nr:proprotein convertase subtilisin/kexin type 4 isoform X1 [Parus major]